MTVREEGGARPVHRSEGGGSREEYDEIIDFDDLDAVASTSPEKADTGRTPGGHRERLSTAGSDSTSPRGTASLPGARIAEQEAAASCTPWVAHATGAQYATSHEQHVLHQMALVTARLHFDEQQFRDRCRQVQSDLSREFKGMSARASSHLCLPKAAPIMVANTLFLLRQRLYRGCRRHL